MSRVVLCIGDSITYGYPFGPAWSWVALVGEALQINMINRGINGDSTANMLYRFNRDVVQHNPDATVIMGGANDAWMGVSLAAVTANFTAMLEKCRQNKILPVLGLPVPVSPGDNDFFNGLEEASAILDQYRQWVQEYCIRNGIQAIDFYTPMLVPGSRFGKPSYYFDGVHPNQEGYQAMSRAAIPVVQKILKLFEAPS
jgi:lysophospholipase L1-like esterase